MYEYCFFSRFNFESPENLKVWKEIMENAIAEGLADDSVSKSLF